MIFAAVVTETAAKPAVVKIEFRVSAFQHGEIFTNAGFECGEILTTAGFEFQVSACPNLRNLQW
jgi:hypothetical protein